MAAWPRTDSSRAASARASRRRRTTPRRTWPRIGASNSRRSRRGVQSALRPLSRVGMLASAAGVWLAVAGCAELGITPPRIGAFGGPSEPTIAAGLREALQIGAERSVARAARPGGFLDDPRVRIPLPPQLDKIGRGLRALGFDSAVDDFEVAMNRAAERAAREAEGPLVAAVAGLRIADARAILWGPDDAATEYLRRASGPALRERFAPVVASAMRSTGVLRAYEELRSRNRALALLKDPTLDLERYVTDETLDGLFTLIREEERRIRNDPAARTTDLLRAVFGEP